MIVIVLFIINRGRMFVAKLIRALNEIVNKYITIRETRRICILPPYPNARSIASRGTRFENFRSKADKFRQIESNGIAIACR